MRQSEAVIVIPTLNEAASITDVLDGFLKEPVDWPIWVIDGGSTDGTRARVRGYARRFDRIALIDNPRRNQAAAINIAARRAATVGAQALVRADAHAAYRQGFASGVVKTLVETGADSVAVPLIATGTGGWQGAAATLQRCWLGHGGAAHRGQAHHGWVRHGHHAGLRLDRFLALGGYDPRFAANEDAEFDLRLAQAGGRIFLDTMWPVAYRPRSTPLRLWRQMHRNGRWRVATAHKHRVQLGRRQLLPVAATLGFAASLGLGAGWHPVALVPAGAYLGLVGALAIAAAGLGMTAVRVALLALVAHLGFGCGALRQAVHQPPVPALARRAMQQGRPA